QRRALRLAQLLEGHERALVGRARLLVAARSLEGRGQVVIDPRGERAVFAACPGALEEEDGSGRIGMKARRVVQPLGERGIRPETVLVDRDRPGEERRGLLAAIVPREQE